MRLESMKYLFDIPQAALNLQQYSKGKTFDEYAKDSLLRSATERQFEIIGEALRKLSDKDPSTAERIREHERIIAFRNILIHAYAETDNHIVWDVLQSKIPMLLEDVSVLLEG